MKKIVISILSMFTLGLSAVEAQQDAMYTHYAYNTLAVNPAYAGSRDALTITGLHRSQWVGFDGAPVTQTLTLHSPFMNDKIGLGMSVVNDKIGPMNVTSFYADFAYRIKVSDKGRLSLGLKGGANLVQGNLSSLELEDQNDVTFSQNIQSSFLPNFGFGAYYTNEKFYVGISTPKLLENDFKNNINTSTSQLSKEERHYFLIAGAVFNIKDGGKIKFRPTTFIKVTEAAPIQGDVSGMFIFQDKFEVGAMYRTGDAAGILLGYNFTPQMRFGYAYDFSFTNRTLTYNGGSHEVMLRYDFIYADKGRIRSPRYF
jgi:type IX secretion system PorP/SprF family membrane protein